MIDDSQRSEDKSFGRLFLLLGNLLEERVDDCHSEHNTGTTSDGTHEICKDTKGTNADTTERGSNVDVAGQVLDHSLFAEVVDGHLLVHQVLDDISRGGTADIDPDSGEEGTGSHHEGAVEQGVEGVTDNISPLTRGADIVCEASNWS